jgi:choline dehydrogenase-like flavoprotein
MRGTLHDCEILVIGSGPGGATTAALLAEAGHDVLMVEEGGHFGHDSAPAYSMAEMDQKYRNGGLTPAFGQTKVTYVEGRCVGGGSEINAALAHPPMARTLEDWRQRFGIADFGIEPLAPHFEAVERECSVASQPGPLDPASMVIKQGADALGWASSEVQRFWQYPAGGAGKGLRQSMTVTLVPRVLAAGGRLMPRTSIRKLRVSGGRAREARGFTRHADGRRERVRIRFDRVIVCGGPTQTPLVLRRSGLRGKIGDGLRLHPMVRVAARFDREVNDPSAGVPVQQVVEFKPHLTLGCSHAALPHLVMWLGGEVEDREAKLEDWRKLALFYVLVTGKGVGKVRNIPGFDESFTSYPCGDEDLASLGHGLHQLGTLLFEAGAVELFNPLPGRPSITRPEELETLRTGLPHGQLTVSAIHLFGTCPMGEDRDHCVVDSWGKLHGAENIWVNDASILPDCTGVNPQLTLMAIARRNVAHLLGG